MQLYGLRYPFAMRVPLGVAAFIVLTFGLTNAAQEPPAVATVRNAPGFHAAAEAQFKTYEAGLSTHCAEAVPDWSKATHRVFGQPQVDTDAKLINATWAELVPGTACGRPRLYHALVVIRGGKARVIPLLPGDGVAGPQLQHDALLPLAGAMGIFMGKEKNCPVDVVNTHFTGSEPAAKQSWTELWTVETCGKHLEVPMQFVPDATGPGTSIHIDPKAIAVLP